MQLVGRDSVVALGETLGSAGLASPVGLDDAGSVEQTAVAPTDAPHADPGLQPDCRPLLPCKVLQSCPPPILKQLHQLMPPPALNDPHPESHVQQCATHQGAPPPGLDLYYFWITDGRPILGSWDLTRKKTRHLEDIPHPLQPPGVPGRDPDALSTITPSSEPQEHWARHWLEPEDQVGVLSLPPSG